MKNVLGVHGDAHPEVAHLPCFAGERPPARRRGARTASRAGRPATPSRSVMRVFMAALRSICRRVSACRRRPTRLAGMTNTGSRASASSVRRQSSTMNIVSSVIRRTQALETSWPSVPVMARWAPITSLLRRLISAPVCTLVKNDTPMRCTWSYSATRRSKMSPSPMRADHQRSKNARSAVANAARQDQPRQQVHPSPGRSSRWRRR